MPDEKVQIRDRLPMLQVWHRSMQSRYSIDRLLDYHQDGLVARKASDKLLNDWYAAATQKLTRKSHIRVA